MTAIRSCTYECDACRATVPRVPNGHTDDSPAANPLFRVVIGDGNRSGYYTPTMVATQRSYNGLSIGAGVLVLEPGEASDGELRVGLCRRCVGVILALLGLRGVSRVELQNMASDAADAQELLDFRIAKEKREAKRGRRRRGAK